MSAIPQIVSRAVPAAPAAPAPRGCGFISLDEAARRSGRGTGHLARRCRSEWAARSLARLEPPPGGGKKEWQVREDADPSLARVPLPEHLPLDPGALSGRQIDVLAARRKLLDEWRQAIARRLPGATKLQATQEFCRLAGEIDGHRISPRTLELWDKAYRLDGPAGLLDDRVARRVATESDRNDDPFLGFVRELYLTPRRLTLAYCHYIAAEQARRQGWAPRTYKACQRFVAALPRQLVTLKREGNKAFEDKCEPAIRRDYSTLASNDIWCADDHTFDVMVRVMVDGREQHVRPTVNAWEDLRSRKIVAWSVIGHAANTDIVLRTFRAGAAEHGLPRRVMVDNGKTFDNRNVGGLTKHQRRAARLAKRAAARNGTAGGGGGAHDEAAARAARVQGAFGLLGIEVQYVRPFHGQSKPIERQFRTVCERFSKLWATYTGTTATKPENLAARIAAGDAPTIEEFAEAFGEWTTVYYNAAHAHGGDAMEGRTPDQVYAECLGAVRRPAPEMLLFATLPRVGPVKVAKHGVTWAGLHFGAFDPAVQALFGQRVMLAIDTDDVSSGVLVLDLDGRLACRARPNLKLGFDVTAADVREASRQKAKLKKTLREYHASRSRQGHDAHDLVRGAAARRLPAAKPVASREALPPPPASLQIHRTGFEDQLPALRQAFSTVPLGGAGGDNARRGEGAGVEDLGRLLAGDDDGGDDDGGGGDGVYADPFQVLSHVLTDGEP